MKVLKFGGTSVGTVESLLNVKAVVESQPEPAIVVVSALGGLTDKLIATARKASAGDATYQEDVNAIFDRHHRVIRGVVTDKPRREEAMTVVNALLQEMADTYDRLAASAPEPPSQADMDLIVSFGERCSSEIVTRMLDGAVRFDSLEIVKTSPRFNRHVLDTETTRALVHKAFDPWRGKIAVAPGFISRDTSTGAITNLGRGGSDYTAAIFAAALGASVLEIWTDVDGFMTADPRKIQDATVIREMSFVEAMELCNFGAKVIYPPTIYPVFHRNIPIIIKNTFNPQAPGTLITGIPEPQGEASLTGLSSIAATARVDVVAGAGADRALADRLRGRALNALARRGVTVLLPSARTPDGGHAVTVIDEADALLARQALADEFEREKATGEIASVEVTPGLSALAVVGCRLRSDSSLALRLRGALDRTPVEALAWSAEGNDSSMAVVVEAASLPQALSALHAEFFSTHVVPLRVAAAPGSNPAPLGAFIAATAAGLARNHHLALEAVEPAQADVVVDLDGKATAQYPRLLMKGRTVVTRSAQAPDVHDPLVRLAGARGVEFITVSEELPRAVRLAIEALVAAGDEPVALAFASLRQSREFMRQLAALPSFPAAVEVTVDPSLKPSTVGVATKRFGPGMRLILDAGAAPAAGDAFLEAVLVALAPRLTKQQKTL